MKHLRVDSSKGSEDENEAGVGEKSMEDNGREDDDIHRRDGAEERARHRGSQNGRYVRNGYILREAVREDTQYLSSGSPLVPSPSLLLAFL